MTCCKSIFLCAILFHKPGAVNFLCAAAGDLSPVNELFKLARNAWEPPPPLTTPPPPIPFHPKITYNKYLTKKNKNILIFCHFYNSNTCMYVFYSFYTLQKIPPPLFYPWTPLLPCSWSIQNVWRKLDRLHTTMDAKFERKFVKSLHILQQKKTCKWSFTFLKLLLGIFLFF